MRAGLLARSWMVGLAALGCTATEPLAPPVTPAEAPAEAPRVAAASEASDAEPADLMTWVRLAAPGRDLPVVGMLVPTNANVNALLAHPELGLRVAVGGTLERAVALDQPADLVMPAPAQVNPKEGRFAFAVGLQPRAADAAALRDVFRVDKIGGHLRLEPTQPGVAGLIGKALTCEIWPAGPTPRLVCASDAPLLDAYGPFLARGALRLASRAALYTKLPGAWVRSSYAAQQKPRPAGQAPSDAEEAGERFGQDFMEQYARDLAGISAELDLQRGQVEVVFEQTFERATSTAALVQCAHVGAPEGLPDAFWRAPNDADGAVFFQGAPPEVMKPIGARAFQELADAIPEMTAAARADMVAATRALFLTGGPAVVAYGHDRAAAQRALERLAAAPPGPRPGKRPDPAGERALLAAHAAVTGWTLVHVDEPSARWRDGLRELTRVMEKRYPKDEPKAGPPSAGGAAPPPKKKESESRMLETWHEVPVKPADGLPPGSLHLRLASRPNPLHVPKGDASRSPSVPSDTHVLMAPDGDGTWLAVAEDEAVARQKLLQTLAHHPGATLRERPDLGPLGGRSGAGAGFFTLAGILSLSLPDDTIDDLGRARALLAQGSALRRQGTAAIPVVWTATAGDGDAHACRARYAVTLGPEALGDVVKWIADKVKGAAP